MSTVSHSISASKSGEMSGLEITVPWFPGKELPRAARRGAAIRETVDGFLQEPCRVRFLADIGPDAVDLRDEGLIRLPDSQIVPKAVAETELCLPSISISRSFSRSREAIL